MRRRTPVSCSFALRKNRSKNAATDFLPLVVEGVADAPEGELDIGILALTCPFPFVPFPNLSSRISGIFFSFSPRDFFGKAPGASRKKRERLSQSAPVKSEQVGQQFAGVCNRRKSVTYDRVVLFAVQECRFLHAQVPGQMFDPHAQKI